MAAVEPLGYRTSFVYDAAGQQVRTVNARGFIRTMGRVRLQLWRLTVGVTER